MSRTTKYKAIYFGGVGVGVALGLWLGPRAHGSPAGFAILILALLLPGRVLGFFWRDLLRGLRLLKARHFAESKQCSQRFLADVQARGTWRRNTCTPP